MASTGRWELSLKGLGAILEDSLDAWRHKPTMHAGVHRQRVSDVVPGQGAAGMQLEGVLVYPLSIGSAELFVHETVGRFPGTHPSAPAHRNTMHADAAVNESALAHDNGKRSQDVEAQSGKGDGIQIYGVRRERNQLRRGQRQPERGMEFVRTHRVGCRWESRTPERETFPRTHLRQSGLGAAVSFHPCSSNSRTTSPLKTA